ncbi:MAG TPA: hypothetical protein VFO70_07605, partial [Chitinophagaceae bacterium]|nr:hypothetical protein [Chitinophagaceae bacterium]
MANLGSTTVQLPFNHCSTTVQPLFNHCSTISLLPPALILILKISPFPGLDEVGPGSRVEDIHR